MSFGNAIGLEGGASPIVAGGGRISLVIHADIGFPRSKLCLAGAVKKHDLAGLLVLTPHIDELATTVPDYGALWQRMPLLAVA